MFTTNVYLNKKDKIMGQMALCGQRNGDYAASTTKAVNFLVA
jgi:hypothetical protein